MDEHVNDFATKLHEVNVEKKILRIDPETKLKRAKEAVEDYRDSVASGFNDLINKITEAYEGIIVQLQNDNDQQLDQIYDLQQDIEKLKEERK
ncbi:MAG: hypothetical protein DRQ46_00030 [Gammaproteobacteria bacterium]|nr:MAG: hypothetical protein DRQ46_00030 [Gammaproteobacteria bacterium]